ncbi:hypothetical protein [Halomicrobium katesii]|uniref:hypothetical protein n=1 Tax=Halomicrobium katesii TaxID=437163 RepID=UPI001461534B|nr:hypothetical protein [Halomicrobium katesii]
MSEADYFFSALAQSTAAIAGLVITLSAVRYQLERQRRERRTEDLREAMIELEEKYTPILNVIAGEFADDAELYFFTLLEESKVSSEIVEGLIGLHADNPNVTLLWYHLSNISLILTMAINPSEDPSEHYILPPEQYEQIQDSVTWLDENFKENTEFIQSLYSELEIDSSSGYTEDHFSPEMPGDSVQDWLQRHQEYTSKYESLFSGNNLQSFRRVIEEFDKDYTKVDSLLKNTIVDFTPNITKTLKYSSLLIAVGVFLPLLALTTKPPEVFSFLILTDQILYLYELLLLVLSVIFTYMIAESVTKDITGEYIIKSQILTLFKNTISRMTDE